MSGNPQASQKVEVSFYPALTLSVLLEQHLQNQPQAIASIQRSPPGGPLSVPVQYERIMRLENYSDFDLSSLQVTFSTSAPLRAALKADILDRFLYYKSGDAGYLDEESIRTWANAKLGKLQRISQLVFVDELPKSSIGKILKKELRERLKKVA